MDFDVFGYNFPHWKTNQGLLHLILSGHKPKCVVLQNKKSLSVPVSDYRISPIEKEILHPLDICNRFGIKTYICEHNDFKGNSPLGIILGARILSKEIISRYDGIINIHPGILPGNRGLDNLKWSIIKRLPIGVTAHFIDHRIDMGRTLSVKYTKVFPDDTIRDVFIRQRMDQMDILLQVMNGGLYHSEGAEIEKTEKFSAVPKELDEQLETYWNDYKAFYHITELPTAHVYRENKEPQPA